MSKTVKLNGGGTLKINLDKLQAVEEQLKKKYVARVGVLGAKSTDRKVAEDTKTGKRKPGKTLAEMTNADIGLIHEKGSLSLHIPRRSFLMMPLETKLADYSSIIGKVLLQGIETENVKVAYIKMGALAEGIIQRAFASRGFGKWAPNKPSTVAQKGSDSPLIDTKQLRGSISSTVVTI